MPPEALLTKRVFMPSSYIMRIERNFLHVVAFIIVETSFHCHYVNVAELAENQFAGVSLHRRNGEVRYFRVRKLVAVSDF